MQEGESRWSALRRQVRAFEKERDDLREILSWILVSEGHAALAAFHRIRGTRYDELLQGARYGREIGGGATHTFTASSGEHVLPPIRFLVDVAGASQAKSQQGRPSFEESAEFYSSPYRPLDPPFQPRSPSAARNDLRPMIFRAETASKSTFRDSLMSVPGQPCDRGSHPRKFSEPQPVKDDVCNGPGAGARGRRPPPSEICCTQLSELQQRGLTALM